MSCDHHEILNHGSELLDGSLAPALRERCETALQNCAQCRHLLEQASEFRQLAANWQDEPVPHWSRMRSLSTAPKRHQGSWLNWGAITASVLTLVLVLSRAEISTRDGLVISFGNGPDEASLQQLVAAEVAASTASQNALIGARFEQQTILQLDANRQLYAQLQESSRLERRQELGMLLSSWQNQRNQDQQMIATRFNELAGEQIEGNLYLNTLMQTLAQPGRNSL